MGSKRNKNRISLVEWLLLKIKKWTCGHKHIKKTRLLKAKTNGDSLWYELYICEDCGKIV